MELVVSSDVKPLKVDAWTAATPTKDFRDSAWSSHSAESSGEKFRCVLPRAKSGHAALFAELTFESDVPGGFQLSTQLRITGPQAN